LRSTNSPFGKADIPATNPGQKYSISFQTGLPEYFESVASYDNFLETLVTPIVTTQKKIWWDLRLHPDTIEFRICDMSLTVEETMCIVSVQAVVAKLYKLNNKSFNIYRLALIKENKFGRHAMAEGHMIDRTSKEVETRVLILELLDFVDDVVMN
jgi:carboxylate-amine ligase